MGHKSNPIGLRLQINRTWDSRWYAEGRDYAKLLSEDIEIRKHNDQALGRLLGGLDAWDMLGEGGASYRFAAGQTYTGTLAVAKRAEGVEITGTLMQDGEVLSTFSQIDPGSDIDTLGMLAFHVNSKTFGSSKSPGETDNGLDFTNVKLEVLAE